MDKEKVVIIGAGAVGQSIGYLLAENNYEILGFISRSLESAQSGVELVGEGIATTEYRDFVLEADLIVITTPDQVIQQVAAELFAQNLVPEGSCLIHFSGAEASSILIPESENEGKYGRLSLHPLQSIADVERGIANLPESFFTIEGNSPGCKVGKQILERLGVEYEIIPTEAKPVYHAAACVASNYLVAIADLAAAMNEKVGISRENALAGLLPLMKGTLENIQDLGPTQALTGPISRGDVETIHKHTRALKDLLPDKLELYQKLGSYTTEVANEKGSITTAEFEKLSEILKLEGE